ncbi:hypothetical protein EJ063_08865 [Vibrio aquaticus]|uniref:SCP domain-containing protein n=1 Tax=Vibrio aquaticus TaxID=2496559 RepID=A0A432CZS6_9VIBR|nr:CAP domain-containing protein [Vibrio aquaticus]RTZ16888.1 hypothetical protein EJ063_08865 [Vibrio aquaticus]
MNKSWNAKKLSLITMGIISLYGCNDSIQEDSQVVEFTAIDGYLSNAEVFLDFNDNGIADDGEPLGTTDRRGKVSLELDQGTQEGDYRVMVRAIAGVTRDADSGLLKKSFSLTAPPGYREITPLSTLVSTQMEMGKSEEDAVTEVASMLGVKSQDVMGDFISRRNKDVAFVARNLINADVIPKSPLELKEQLDTPDSSELTNTNNASIAKIKEVLEDPSLSDQDLDSIVVDDKGQKLEDTDGDQVPDVEDKYPNDPDRWADGSDEIEHGSLDITAINEARASEYSAYTNLHERAELAVSEELNEIARLRANALTESGEFVNSDFSSVVMDDFYLEPEKELAEIRYLSTSGVPTIEEAVAEWELQGANFNINAFDESNKRFITACDNNEPCYNYAQLVTDRADKVGCATSEYQSGEQEGNFALICVFDKTFIPRYRAYNIHRLSDIERKEYVDTHNSFRSNHYSNKPLHYNEFLEIESQDWADVATKMGYWRHANTHGGVNEINPELPVQGENLWKGGQRPESISNTINAYYSNEVNNLVYDAAEGRSECQDSKVCGHFNQVVWQETKLVGCSVSQYENENWISACRYWPAGNYSGKRFACPTGRAGDIIDEAPHHDVPLTKETIIPFTEDMLSGTVSFTDTNYKNRNNTEECELLVQESATFDLENGIVHDFYGRFYHAVGNQIVAEFNQFNVELEGGYRINEIGQLEFKGNVQGTFQGPSTIDMTMTILSQREDGTYIVEYSYQKDCFREYIDGEVKGYYQMSLY